MYLYEMRIFNSNAASYSTNKIAYRNCYRNQEQEKTEIRGTGFKSGCSFFHANHTVMHRLMYQDHHNISDEISLLPYKKNTPDS